MGNGPSQVPSNGPSQVPSEVPSHVPSQVPSNGPSQVPSKVPSDVPSDVLSDTPSYIPSKSPSISPSEQPSVSQMPSQSPTIDSVVPFAATVCVEAKDCENTVAKLNADDAFLTEVGEILDADTNVLVTVVEGSGICTPGCSSVPSERRFLYPFETVKDMSPVTSEDNEGRLLTSSTTVVNIIVDMVNTGESVNPTQLLKQFEDNKSDLDKP